MELGIRMTNSLYVSELREFLAILALQSEETVFVLVLPRHVGAGKHGKRANLHPKELNGISVKITIAINL
jgi:hypothetical protein